MSYGKVEERSSSRRRYQSTARYAATSATLTATSSKSDKALPSRTVNARPGVHLPALLVTPQDEKHGPPGTCRQVPDRCGSNNAGMCVSKPRPSSTSGTASADSVTVSSNEAQRILI